MNNQERNKLRHEVYTLWYNSKDKNKTYNKKINNIIICKLCFKTL